MFINFAGHEIACQSAEEFAKKLACVRSGHMEISLDGRIRIITRDLFKEAVQDGLLEPTLSKWVWGPRFQEFRSDVGR